MHIDLLILLSRWSPLFVWLLAKYYELTEFRASYKHRRKEGIKVQGYSEVKEALKYPK